MDANSQRLRQEPDKNRQAKYRPMQVSLKIECLLCYTSRHHRPSNRRHLPCDRPAFTSSWPTKRFTENSFGGSLKFAHYDSSGKSHLPCFSQSPPA